MELVNGEIVSEEFHPGDFIFFEEDIDFHFYIIEEGEVQIFIKDNAGKRVNLATLGPGESFGELAMLDRSPRSASAQAVTYTKLFKVSEAGYERLMKDLPDWTQAILGSFANRIRRMNDTLKEQNVIIEKLKQYDFLFKEETRTGIKKDLL